MPTTEPGIMKLSARSTNKLLGVAVASGLAAASLSAVPTANAWCVGVAGININLGGGGHCSSSLFTFSIGLGPDAVAESNGFLTGAIALGDAVADTTGILTAAWAGGTGSQAFTNGIVSWAVAQGTNVVAQAGNRPADFANFAFNSGQATQGATSTVTAGNGAFNLAANIGGDANAGSATGVPEPMDISAGDGFGNVALNVIGNRNRVSAKGGFLNFAVASGLFGQPGGANGSDNDVTATGSLSAALNSQTVLGEACPVGPCGNEVNANGPFSLVVAAGVVKRLVEGGFGITLANSFNSSTFPPKPPPTNVLAASGSQANGVGLNATASNNNGLAASGTQRNRVRLNPTASNNNGLAASGTPGNGFRRNSTGSNEASNPRQTTSPGGSVHKSFSDRTKKFSDPANRGTGGLARGANGADSTSRGDK